MFLYENVHVNILFKITYSFKNKLYMKFKYKYF
jgi:hypothetical protein